MALLTYPKFQAPDINGVNMDGGLVYFYATGTTTPKDTYSDEAKTVPNTNPVVLDARGEADIYLDGEYKIILKTAADVEVWTIDSFSGNTLIEDLASTAAGKGASLVKFESGATVQDLASTATDDGTKGFHLIYYPPLTGETNVQDYSYNYDNFLRFIPFSEQAAILSRTSTTALDTYLGYAITNWKLYGRKGVFPSGTYRFTGGLSYSLDNDTDIEFEGEGWNSTIFEHTGNNTFLTFAGDGSNIFTRAILRKLRIEGNSGASAVGVEFRDSWGYKIEECYIRDYSAGSALVLHNYLGWTEGVILNDVMFRNNLYSINPKRTASAGGTNSLFGLSGRIYINLQIANAYGIYLNAEDSANTLLAYGWDLDIYSWFVSGGGTNVIFNRKNSQLVDSHIDFFPDGLPTVDGSDQRIIRQNLASSTTSLVDISCTTHAQQGTFYDVSAVAGGSNITLHYAVCHPDDVTRMVNSRASCRMKGAKVVFGDTDQSTDKTFTIASLPSSTAWKITLTVDGTNHQFTKVYVVTVDANNWLAGVEMISGRRDAVTTNPITSADAATQTGSYVQADVQTIATLANELKTDVNTMSVLLNDINRNDDTTGQAFYLEAYGSGENHAYSAGNGNKVDLVLNASTGPSTTGNYAWLCEMEML